MLPAVSTVQPPRYNTPSSLQPVAPYMSAELLTETITRSPSLSSPLYMHIPHLWHSEDRASWYILKINQRDALISQIYFWNRTLHVSDRFSVHHQESSTVYTVLGICHTRCADWSLAGSGWNSVPTCMTYTYCSVYSTRLLMTVRKPVRNM